MKPEPASGTSLGNEEVWSQAKVTFIVDHQKDDAFSTVKHEPLDIESVVQEAHTSIAFPSKDAGAPSEYLQVHRNGVLPVSKLAGVAQGKNNSRVLEKKRRVRSPVPFLPDPLLDHPEREVLLTCPSSSSEDEVEDTVEVVGSVKGSHEPSYILPCTTLDSWHGTILQPSSAHTLPTVVNSEPPLLDLGAEHKRPLPRIARQPTSRTQQRLAKAKKNTASPGKSQEPAQILPTFLKKTNGISEESQHCLVEAQHSAKDCWTGSGSRRGVRVDANGFPVKKNGKMYKTKGYIYEKARAYYERRMATETAEEKALRLEKARQRYYRKKEEEGGSSLLALHEVTGERWSRRQRVHSAKTRKGTPQEGVAAVLVRPPMWSLCPRRETPTPSADMMQAFMTSSAVSAMQGGLRPLLPRPPPPSQDGGEGGTSPTSDYLLAQLQRLRAAALLLQASRSVRLADGGHEETE